MKNRNLSYSALAILFALLSLIAFLSRAEKTTSFWVAYAFTAAAFAAQILLWKKALFSAAPLRSRFLGFPVVSIGAAYLIVQVIAFAVVAAFPLLPPDRVAVACSVILGISVVFMIAGEVGRNEIERVEAGVHKKVLTVKEWRASVELFARAEADARTKDELLRLAENIRFCDPISDDALEELEQTIAEAIEKLRNTPEKLPAIEELHMLLAERNEKCKIGMGAMKRRACEMGCVRGGDWHDSVKV